MNNFRKLLLFFDSNLYSRPEVRFKSFRLLKLKSIKVTGQDIVGARSWHPVVARQIGTGNSPVAVEARSPVHDAEVIDKNDDALFKSLCRRHFWRVDDIAWKLRWRFKNHYHLPSWP